jgi:hypothetical protein
MIGGLAQDIFDLEDADLGGGTYRTRQRADLIDLEPIPCLVFYDPDDPPPLIASEEWILTYPFPPGVTLVGTGFIVEVTAAELVTSELMVGSFDLQLDGQTGPIFTDPTGTFSDKFSSEFA